jgi:RNA polymerase sigma factor (sigma-70 family)
MTTDGSVRPQAGRAGLFIAALPDIEAAVRFVSRRHHLARAEEEEFAAEVKLALIDRDYEVLARFEGRSSLRTYLVTVVQRLFLDYRRRLWGKWRPSAEAERRGAAAVRLEVLLYRDGLTLDEAVETLRTNFAVTETREALAELARALPARVSRRPAGEEEMAALPAPETSSPEAQLESGSLAARAQALLAQALSAESARDRIVLRMRFEDGLSVADVARTLRLDQKKLYRDLEGLFGRLRKWLEDGGLRWDEARRLIETGSCHLCLPPEIGGPQPSQEKRQP